ncbi:MAG: pentapeptide repeat-containing protein [Caldilinea sp.]
MHRHGVSGADLPGADLPGADLSGAEKCLGPTGLFSGSDAWA